MSADISSNLERLRERIARGCERVGRDPRSVELVAVSKAHSEAALRVAYEAGLRVFAENYAQELAAKAEALRDLPDVRWRFVGHLQRNKIKLVERARATVDTVDTLRLAEALSARARAGEYETEVLIQVNVGGEPQKSGCSPDALPELVAGLRALPGLRLRGLMTVAPHFDDPDNARPSFAALRRLAEAHDLPTTSMGMSHDLEAAITEGATMLRIGTAIFGKRPPKPDRVR